MSGCCHESTKLDDLPHSSCWFEWHCQAQLYRQWSINPCLFGEILLYSNMGSAKRSFCSVYAGIVMGATIAIYVQWFPSEQAWI